ncbi:MAG: hypothetical protein BWK78_01335 [Thiotrichaceae bacterium IS1]|nr:MAG: hypothetical protein BWK78_01335 [Thiotrichaceae bacterium IS1]
MLKTSFSNSQLEILELYGTELTEQDLTELKLLLANFYAKKAIQQADSIWEEQHFSQATMESWLNEPT